MNHICPDPQSSTKENCCVHHSNVHTCNSQVCVCWFLCVCVCLFVCVCACMCLFVYICIVYVCVFVVVVCECACLFVCVYIYVHALTHARTSKLKVILRTSRLISVVHGSLMMASLSLIQKHLLEISTKHFTLKHVFYLKGPVK